MRRVLLVSNRLPVTVRMDKGQVSVERSMGGLATGLSRPHAESGGLWLGWPGDVSRLSPEQLSTLESQLRAQHIVPLYLTAGEVSRYYEGFSNRDLWPLFHDLLDRIPLHTKDWSSYKRVNERFADLVVQHAQPGDLIWVHDYQLMLVPQMVRERLPHARIGFFLHIPFPPSDVFRTLPWREEVLRGVLGADLIGFHTLNYVRHFSSAILRLLGLDTEGTRVAHEGRTVQLGAFPMGIDAAEFDQLARTPETEKEVKNFRANAPGQKLLLGVDRMDYTKGIRRRFLALARLLELHPELRGKVKLVQVAVPSRTNVDQYEVHRKQIDEMVGRINGQYGSVNSLPIHYLYRGFPQKQLVAMYKAADVMLVTPLRDGMNLVAKEFVASRPDEDGVLLLSEFAGASEELPDSITINPYDIDGMARSIHTALTMPREERQARMQGLRKRVLTHDVHAWVSSFLGRLSDEQKGPKPPRDAREILPRIREAGRLALMIDYDGTLVGFTDRPEKAVPDAELMSLLTRLTQRKATEVHIVSGRPRASLEGWFGALPVGLHAEHGLWSRVEGEWRQRELPRDEWRETVKTLFAEYSERVPGAFTEEKSSSLAWHYRQADREFGAFQARELRLHLSEFARDMPIDVLQGHMVVEVRPRGVHKGRAVEALGSSLEGALVVAFGDDTTDEDLFRALPPESLAIHVGSMRSIAPYHLRDPKEVRWFLSQLLA